MEDGGDAQVDLQPMWVVWVLALLKICNRLGCTLLVHLLFPSLKHTQAHKQLYHQLAIVGLVSAWF